MGRLPAFIQICSQCFVQLKSWNKAKNTIAKLVELFLFFAKLEGLNISYFLLGFFFIIIIMVQAPILGIIDMKNGHFGL